MIHDVPAIICRDPNRTMRPNVPDLRNPGQRRCAVAVIEECSAAGQTINSQCHSILVWIEDGEGMLEEPTPRLNGQVLNRTNVRG